MGQLTIAGDGAGLADGIWASGNCSEIIADESGLHILMSNSVTSIH
jgi:hypothetical protein